jgi:hypothetical protein
MKKLFMRIDLNNKFIFFIILFLLSFVFAYIENIFFYDYVRVKDYLQVKSLGKNIHFIANNCIKDLNNQEFCINKIKNYLENIKPYALIKINGDVIYKRIKPRHANRGTVYLPENLQYIDSLGVNLNIVKYSKPNILLATIRGATFSIYDILNRMKYKSLGEVINWYFYQRIYLRSRYILISFILLYIGMSILRNQQRHIKNKIETQNLKIVNLVKNIETNKDRENELIDTINNLKNTSINYKMKLQQYDDIINPPIDILKYDDLLNLDPESVIIKCRKVTEKIITELYNKNIGEDYHKNLNDKIAELSRKKIIPKKTVSYANTIRAFGNISAHIDVNHPVSFSKEDAKIISNALILLIESMAL